LAMIGGAILIIATVINGWWQNRATIVSKH
jgi:hypothetical protein